MVAVNTSAYTYKLQKTLPIVVGKTEQKILANSGGVAALTTAYT